MIPPTPLPRKRACLPPLDPKGGATLICEGVGGPTSDNWSESLALCILCEAHGQFGTWVFFVGCYFWGISYSFDFVFGVHFSLILYIYRISPYILVALAYLCHTENRN
jgi:hypothetical protein